MSVNKSDCYVDFIINVTITFFIKKNVDKKFKKVIIDNIVN